MSNPVSIAFQRNGHSRSILASRNGNAAASIHYKSGIWTIQVHGAQLEEMGGISTVSGNHAHSYAYAKGGLAAWSHLHGQEFAYLKEAMQALVDADPKAVKHNCQSNANRLLQNFRQYECAPNAK